MINNIEVSRHAVRLETINLDFSLVLGWSHRRKSSGDVEISIPGTLSGLCPGTSALLATILISLVYILVLVFPSVKMLRSFVSMYIPRFHLSLVCIHVF